MYTVEQQHDVTLLRILKFFIQAEHKCSVGKYSDAVVA